MRSTVITDAATIPAILAMTHCHGSPWRRKNHAPAPISKTSNQFPATLPLRHDPYQRNNPGLDDVIAHPFHRQTPMPRWHGCPEIGLAGHRGLMYSTHRSLPGQQ
jgi:hypothetical protein